MSKVKKSILNEIEYNISLIENVIESFSSKSIENNNVIKEHDNKDISLLKTCMLKTKTIYAFIQNSGSFPNTYHSPNTTDAMGKWVVEIDNLCWALFGCEIKHDYTKQNRMHYINDKLEHIHEKLKLYIPSRC